MLKRFLLVLFVALSLVTGTAVIAGVDWPSMPSLNGKGVISETDQALGAGTSTIGTLIYWVSDDTAVNALTGVAVDTGAEACAAYGMDCIVTVAFAVAGGSGDEFTAVTDCSTDNADTTILFSVCN